MESQFRAILRILNCFLDRNYSAIPRNEMAQMEAIIHAIPLNGIRLETLPTRDEYLLTT